MRLIGRGDIELEDRLACFISTAAIGGIRWAMSEAMRDGRSTSFPSSSASPRGLRPLVLIFSAFASFANGAVGHGIFFVLTHQHGFDDRLNLLFALAMYFPYIPAALYAGRLSAALGDRTLLITSVGLMTICAGILTFDTAAITCWIVAPAYTMLAGFQWPIVESYLTAGRHGPDMRRAIGIWNITWGTTICLGLWAVGFLLEHSSVLFAILAGVHGLTLVIAATWPRRIPHHDHAEAEAHQSPEYPSFLQTCQSLLFLSYVLGYALTPLLPGVWSRLGIDLDVAAYLSSAWLIARIVPFSIMYFKTNWHGRWSIPLIAGLLLIVGFTLAVTGVNTAFVITGLIAFGLGHATSYFTAIYYRLAVGRAQVKSGGRHEAVMGLGYTIGPAIVLGGSVLFPASQQTGIFLGVGGLTLISIVVAVRPFVLRRRRRPVIAK